mmetsp:Transcript_20782/g.44957  ORF Transcript_20782/g.44957 Transcript_20782/m.44957 type:complete len:257 (+) Transcript_20782:1741-2511(+)
MVLNLPFTILIDVDIGVSPANFLTGCTHRKFINTGVLSPIGPNCDLTAKDLALRLELEEIGKVINYAREVSANVIRNGRQQHSILGVTFGNLNRILSGKSIVPQVEQSTNFFLCDRLRSDNSFWHYTRVVVVDLPFAILIDVNEAVASLDRLAGSSHFKLIDSRVLAPVFSNGHMTLQDGSSGLQLEEIDEVIFNGRKVGTSLVRNSRQKYSLLGIACSNLLGIEGSEGVVPKTEQSTNLILSDGLAHGNLFGHDG